MTKPTKSIPKFKTEAQERRFWSTAQRAVFPYLKPSTKTISLRLPEHLLDAIKSAANSRDVPYQSLIKVWLQERVDRD
ncbi:MAG: BrnA antitoxin family protein [Steroidobacteraceae bacterium]